MMKKYQTLATVLLLISLIMLNPVSARASSNATEQSDKPSEEAEVYVILPGIIEDGGGTLTKIYQLSGTSIAPHTGVDTYHDAGDEYFYITDLPSTSTSIYVKGKLTSTASNPGYTVRIGIGPYGRSFDTVFDEKSIYVKPGIDFTSQLCNKSAFDAGVKLYGVIHNEADAGYVTGTVGFYYVQ